MHKEYNYSGPVMQFGKCVLHTWTATTYAPSKQKAMSNLKYRYKRDHNLVSTANITLPGKLTEKQ